MNKIITLAAAAAVLALAGCNRDAETAPTADDATAAGAEAASADGSGSDASATASGGARAAGDAGSASEAMAPEGAGSIRPTGETASGVSDQTRDNAQAEAEATNLHPKPPGAR